MTGDEIDEIDRFIINCISQMRNNKKDAELMLSYFNSVKFDFELDKEEQ